MPAGAMLELEAGKEREKAKRELEWEMLGSSHVFVQGLHARIKLNRTCNMQYAPPLQHDYRNF